MSNDCANLYGMIKIEFACFNCPECGKKHYLGAIEVWLDELVDGDMKECEACGKKFKLNYIQTRG